MFKNPSFLFDIICTAAWIILVVRYARKGFLSSIVQLVGNLFSLLGAKELSAACAGWVFEHMLAGGFRTQIAANIAAGGAVDLSGIAESMRASCLLLSALPSWQPASAPLALCWPITRWCWPIPLWKRAAAAAHTGDHAGAVLLVLRAFAPAGQYAGHGAGPCEQAAGHWHGKPRPWLACGRCHGAAGYLFGAVHPVGHHRHHRRQPECAQRYGDEQQSLLQNLQSLQPFL